jgi:hypothetical protein
MRMPSAHTYTPPFVGAGGDCIFPGCGRPARDSAHATDAILGYGGTSGWSGSVTSEKRARRADASGATGRRQAAVLAFLEEQQGHGATSFEIEDHFGWGHGVASGALSNLHKGNPEKDVPPKIDRLAEQRGDCEVYVLPEYVHGRETRQQGRTRPTLLDVEQRALDSLRDAIRTGAPEDRMDVATVVAALDRLL